MNEGWMRLGKGVVDFWMETVELNQTWSFAQEPGWSEVREW